MAVTYKKSVSQHFIKVSRSLGRIRKEQQTHNIICAVQCVTLAYI